jgi:anti-sigma regulatory factor (Ser/Thr protein kinase)
MNAYAELRLPRASSAVASARAFVLEVVTGWGCGDACDPVQLVVSELAANAVRHSAGEEFELRMRHEGDEVWVAVVDGSQLPPQLRHPRLEDEGGRGLHIVDALSRQWGHHREGDGKVVWSRLSC